MVGLVELGMIALSAFGGTCAVSVPPGDTDSQLHDIAPQQCFIYHSWTAAADARRDSDNRLEQLLAEPDVQRAIGLVVGEVRRLVTEFSTRDKTPGSIPFTQLLLQGSEIIYRNPGAIYLWTASKDTGPPGIRVAAVIASEDQAARLDGLLTALLKALAGDTVKRWEAPVGRFQQAIIMPGVPPLVWGLHDDCFIAALGNDAIGEMLGRWDNKPPAWLVEIQETIPIERPATVSYLNVQQLRGVLGTWFGDAEVVEQAVVALGLDNVRHAALSSGMSGPDWASHGVLALDGEARGLLGTLVAGELSLADLSSIPPDTLVATAWNIDPDKLYLAALEVARKLSPEETVLFDQMLEFMERQFEFRLREELLQSLGDTWTISCDRQGSLVTGWTATVAVKDRGKLEQTIEKLAVHFVTLIEDLGEDRPRLHREKHGDANLFILDIPGDDVLVIPSLAVTDKQLVFALYPQIIREQLRRPATAPSLASNPAVRKLFGEDRRVLGMAVVDNRSLLEFAYPLAQMGVNMIASEWSKGSAIDGSILPPADVISRHLGQERAVLYMDKVGLHFEQRGDLPGVLLLPIVLPALWLDSGRVINDSKAIPLFEFDGIR